ncbi:NLR family CARD domain-containing protein 3 [Chanos chanos]|uniref:NLR family CARD domain-containing protein 3 n=1 Tax=Chanos chanos TaxID=29144 RepID=A0A6J2VJ82_CHACN|nr:NLR family CARD domain-containing protein 3-like [Chanos chanos]
MAVGPCSVKLQQRRVELVQEWSGYITPLLELLFQVGALTEEDLSLIRGGGCTGERERMRTLLDVLFGRGEEACRAFFHLLPRIHAETRTVNAGIQQNMREHLIKHRNILVRQHCHTDYLNIRGQPPGQVGAGSFTDITFSQHVGYAVPLQHETAIVGDAFRGFREESRRQDEICVFRDVQQNLLSTSGDCVTLLSGVAGSGKTTAVRRLVWEWAADTQSQKILLSLSFRELNLITEQHSLLELLSVHYSHLKPILSEIMSLNPARILLILDGLDEFRFPLDFDRTPKCSDPERELPVGAMVVNLIKGNLLPGISLLLTSRPHAVSKVPPLLVNQFYSVLGFSPAQQQQYFEQTCSSPQVAAAVWGFVSSQKPLLLMCHIPAFCWIVSTALHDGFSPCLDRIFLGAASINVESTRVLSRQPGDVQTASGSSTLSLHSLPSQNSARTVTITEIYCCFLKSILLFHVKGQTGNSNPHRLQDAPRVLQEMKPILKHLGKLAFRGLLERRFLFDCSDLDSISVEGSEFSRALLVEIVKEDQASLTYERNFHFIHTSVQEFLAALYYVLESLSGTDPFSGLKCSRVLFHPTFQKHLNSIVQRLHRPRHLLAKCIKKAFHWSARHQSGHMDLFCRFVSGLLVPRTQFILDGLFTERPNNSGTSVPLTPSFLLQLLHSQLQSSCLSPERQINTCHCLYEAQDSGLSQRLQGWLGVLAQQESNQSISEKRDWSELAFLLQLSPDLQILKLDAQGLDAEGLHRLLPVLPLFSTLSLGQNPLGPEGAAVLSLALQSPDCRVERLWVVATGLGCEGLRILAEALKSNRTVVDLRMAINHIGDDGAGYLADLLKSNRTLKDIRLRDNQVTDKGAELIMAALLQNTTLEYLWMFDNKFSKEGVQKLKDFAKSRASLDIKVCI